MICGKKWDWLSKESLVARPDNALHCVGDAFPVGTSLAEPYACKQTTALPRLRTPFKAENCALIIVARL